MRNTGDFTEEGLVDDISGLKPKDIYNIYEWQKEFEKQYVHVGKLVGRFYDHNGKPLPALSKVREAIKR